mmetsp:Transcript_14720/g.16855  ORF Transcript_14720/g.16855 Transcript_14720/m.16855 type:complete len:103 (+) Transcript_14720:93-401(+)
MISKKRLRYLCFYLIGILSAVVQGQLDSNCAKVSKKKEEGESICKETTDLDGSSCVWCDVAGDFGICFSKQEAEQASKYMECQLSSSFSSYNLRSALQNYSS